jgi:hypothetical protein
MTVYRNADEARVDPSVLSKGTSTLLGMKTWFADAYKIYHDDEKSSAFKAGYLFSTLKLIEENIKIHGL